MAFLQKLEQRVFDRKRELFSPRRVIVKHHDIEGEVGALTALLAACDAFTDFTQNRAEKGDRIAELCHELSSVLRLRLDANEAKQAVVGVPKQKGFAFELHPRTAESHLASCLKEHTQPAGLSAKYVTRVSSDGFIVECDVSSPDKSHVARVRAVAANRQLAREHAAAKMLQLLGFGLPEGQ